MIVYTVVLLSTSLSFLSIVLPGVKGLPIKTCTDDQYKRKLSNGSLVCVDCLKCPVGLGPSVECGSEITADTRIHCMECIAGKSFSPFNDFEQCQQCSVCSEDQAKKPCTPTSDTVCEKRCISKGKYYEKSSDDCQDCTWCCGDGKDTMIDECLKKGMPAKKSCTVHRKKSCKPPPTTAIPSTVTIPTRLTLKSPAKKTIKDNNINYQNSREPVRRNPSNRSISQHSNIRNSSLVNNSPTTDLQVLVGVCCGLGFLLAACMIYLLIVYRKKKKEGKQKVVYTVKEDEVSIIAANKESRLLDILSNDYELKLQVCKKLDLKNSFAKLARCCKMDEDSVRKLEEHPGNEPTSHVFEWIEGNLPDFKFGEFSKLLKEIGRKDVLKCCIDKLQSSKKIPLTVNS